jgi:Putative adhesin
MAATAPPSTARPVRATRPLRLTPGRRIALAAGLPLCLLLIAGTGLSVVADLGIGKYPVSYTVPAAAKVLDLSLSGGHLDIKPGTASQPARLTGTAKYSLIRSTFTTRASGDGVRVGYQCPMPVGTCDLDATVNVPPTMPVTASSGGGGASVTGLTSPVSLSTGGGDITADRLSGRLTLTTGGGNVNGDDLRSPAVEVRTGGGDVELIFATVPADVQVDTGGGDITILLPDGPATYAVSTSTGGGDVTGDIADDPGAPSTITASTGGGDITIRHQ